MASRSDRLVLWVAAMWQLEHVMFFLVLVVIDIARAKWRRTPAFNLTLPYLKAVVGDVGASKMNGVLGLTISEFFVQIKAMISMLCL